MFKNFFKKLFETNVKNNLIQKHSIPTNIIILLSFDVICVILAFVLGGEIGIGTIIITIFLGPVIDFFHGFITKTLK